MIATFLAIYYILAIILWVWTFRDLFQKRHTHNLRFLTKWFMVVLFFPVIGSIFYFQSKGTRSTTESRTFQPAFNRHIYSRK